MERRQKNRNVQKFQKRGYVPVLERGNPAAMAMGYARVSRDDQNLDMQLQALKAGGVQKFFVEKISAVNAHRPQFQLLMKCVEKGDTVLVYAFNRLVRDLKQLLTIVDEFKAMGVKLRSTSEPHIDPFSTNGRMVLSVTGAVDENELRRIKDRTRDGMAERKRQGMFFGRKRIVTPEVERRMRQMRWKQKIDVKIIARREGVKPSTVYANTKL